MSQSLSERPCIIHGPRVIFIRLWSASVRGDDKQQCDAPAAGENKPMNKTAGQGACVSGNLRRTAESLRGRFTSI